MILGHALFILVTVLGLFLSSGPAFAEPKVRRNVEIEFEAIEGATKYEIQVVQKGAKRKPMRFQLKAPFWTASIKPGLYSMQIRSFDDRGVPGDWSPPTDLQVKLPAIIPITPQTGTIIKSGRADEQNVKFQWEPVPEAAKYEIFVRSNTSDFKKEEVIEGTSLDVALPAGQNYEWNAVAIDSKGEKGEVLEQPFQFEMRGPPLSKPQFEKPRSKYVREISWKAPDFANSYSYELRYYNPAKKAWESVDQKPDLAETEIKMDYSRPSGRYRAVVQAHGPRREPSAPEQMDFYMKGGFRDPASFENAILRDSISRPSNFYAIASYLVTQIDYKGTNFDDTSTPSFGAFGGTGRIGVGYNNADSNWGGFGIVDLSGFVIEGQNFQFASAEAHATRRLEFGQGGLLLFGSGLFYKQLPIVSGYAGTGFTGVGKVSNIGPHAGFTYWTPLNDRLGLQLNARLYYTLMGSASTGPKALSSMSYQFGVLGSYRLNRYWMGYAGYAYRLDEANYETRPDDPQSFAQPGQTNSVSISGHYLNLILEFSF